MPTFAQSPAFKYIAFAGGIVLLLGAWKYIVEKE